VRKETSRESMQSGLSAFEGQFLTVALPRLQKAYFKMGRRLQIQLGSGRARDTHFVPSGLVLALLARRPGFCRKQEFRPEMGPC
jgi:hypothetical protein